MQQKQDVFVEKTPAALLYQRHASALLAYIYRQIKSSEDAEDILLEVFLVTLEREQFWSMEANEQQAFLWRVARNKVADHYRRFTRRPSVPLKQVTETIYERDDLAPEQVALKQEEYAQLYQVLSELPDKQQELLMLALGMA
ncbi:RNA polymerase sigma factor [Dictyobacter kobayashii]|uniref:RNA polymerase sigma-70 region 2 domain-containing protein n=1 Tax=Dictyobacter kobayashii TaxID=2014872 RepID=A0A402AET7_9CHLR|nr:sigma-70 family RNA polymerase sigma factor [Dictyobacter kobayashii]GCE17596.1 hypothetical protein KDK_13960 [Dictyobacter kobayashii]